MLRDSGPDRELAPQGTSLAEPAGAAGLRWTIEEAFQRAKDDLGPDHCEVRSWHGWPCPMTLVMAAAAFLGQLVADQSRLAFGKEDESEPDRRSSRRGCGAATSGNVGLGCQASTLRRAS